MMRALGTTARGIRTPIIKEGDDLPQIVVESLLKAVESEGFSLHDNDVIGITESLVARSQGNYVTLQDIAKDVNEKFEGDIALMFPILSRNRFSVILKALALTGKKIHLFLNYPSDEVGNSLMNIDKMDELNINPYIDLLTEKDYRKLFGEKVEHKFTGIDYISMYKEISDNIIIYLANDPREALKYSKEILVANIHERERTKRILKNAGAKTVYGLDEILTESIDGSGYNADYGLLGSNKATEDKVKLFPRDCKEFVIKVQKSIKESTGKNIEVMVYGDGAFKDPVGKIWELADPVVSPGFTDGLLGTPNEIKIKYIADNDFKGMSSAEMTDEMKKKIKAKEGKKVEGNENLGTTPRQITDLLGSLCDLISGSGDKGTPVVLVQGYFDNYATEY
ncbi:MULTISPECIES: coenzyme F420-0:L-glutamate ligase [Clostridium]|uniref:F420-0 gamma-glutamyl ligase n=1 Tax=Clostridium putrefaciens TaxID=99675 RepID=A0A381JAT0_9CLOT|nr:MULTISPECIES: coenzyme F420-0:L-glutamate ligase [Clostridium]MBU3202901.1 coenzyme F420-0:L-glutamate ligase [Clostridium algidicarnis]MBU3211055.1 coenzyme F420-0:L-glutamate ligase [Clostridium algidicarnis]MBU3222437.1 coenzyme F420-0:L-glutamate ligase [Clostridium algidicarnis]SUY47546.1 F420-0 gamma-glutamyl ligase [Clostridium putrefaciens]